MQVQTLTPPPQTPVAAPAARSTSHSLPSVTTTLDTSKPAAPGRPDSGIHPKTHTFIEGYDNAVVHSNIHLPAEAQPVRSGRASSVATIEGVGATPSASRASFKLAAIPDASKLSAQTDRYYQRALVGGPADLRALAEWAGVHEAENELLRTRVRKQQHDFASLFEMVGATSARALDVVSLQNYMLRTVSGHFAAPKVMIVRRMRPEDRDFYFASSQGVKCGAFGIHRDSPLCRRAFERGASFSLRDFPDPMREAPEIDMLRMLGMEMAVPLLQEVDRTGAVLEGFVFIGPKLTRKPFLKSDLEFLDVMSKMFAICLRNENLYRRSIIDTLTGVSSRGHFDAQLAQELQHAADNGEKSTCLMMLDVDHFKDFNDTYGHQVGDLVLKSLAKVLVQQVRNVDLVARYGGEEFAIIFVEIDKTVAIEVCERLMKAVREMEITAPDGKKLHITASFGIACYPEHAQDVNMLIQMADMALYKSKDAGRNRMTMAEESFKKLPRRPSSRIGDMALATPAPPPWTPDPAMPGGLPVALEIIQGKQAQAANNPNAAGEHDRRGK